MEFSEGSEDDYYVDHVQFSDELSDLDAGGFSEEDGEVFWQLHCQ